MCLAFPAKIVAIKDSLATVEKSGVKRDASLMLLPDAKVGDYVKKKLKNEINFWR